VAPGFALPGVASQTLAAVTRAARAGPGEVRVGEQAREDIEEMVFAEVEVAWRIGGSG